jgi:ABC-type phosphate/phosphonate transport system substrate-binding protein
MREYAVNRDHCLELVERWHRMRNDLERALGIPVNIVQAGDFSRTLQWRRKSIL